MSDHSLGERGVAIPQPAVWGRGLGWLGEDHGTVQQGTRPSCHRRGVAGVVVGAGTAPGVGGAAAPHRAGRPAAVERAATEPPARETLGGARLLR